MNIGSENGTPTLTWALGEELDLAEIVKKFDHEKEVLLTCYTKALKDGEVENYFWNRFVDLTAILHISNEINTVEHALCHAIAGVYNMTIPRPTGRTCQDNPTQRPVADWRV